MSQMWQDIQAFDAEGLIWLRPWAFWLFIVAGIWFLIYLVSSRHKQTWQKHISPFLRPYVITEGKKWINHMPFAGFFLALCFGIIALAGPSWKKVEMPASKVSARMVIALNLSPSMLAEDLQPNRLERAKMKIGSILKADPGVETGVFVYAGTPHLLLPPTADYLIIEKQLENLSPGMMPLAGNNTRLLFGLIDSLFSKFIAPGTFTWVTDIVTESDVSWIRNFVSNTPHHIELLILSTPAGAVIPGTPSLSRMDEGTLASLESIDKLKVNRLTLDDSDVETIAGRIKERREFSADADNSEEENRDMGLMFIWPMLILLALSFRKGAVIYSWLLLLMLTGNSCSYDKAGAKYWYSQDRIGYEYYKAGEFEKALEHLEYENYRALSFYQLGDYTASAQLFRDDSTASGRYNLGLSLFNLGLYEEAASAFSEAQGLNPNLKQATDALILAKQYAEENTPEAVQKQKLIEGVSVTEDVGKSEELSSEEGKKIDDKDNPNETAQDKQFDNSQRKGKESDKPELSDEETPKMDSKNIVLQKAAADPSDFLRKRFKMQKEKYYPDIR